MEYYNGCFKLRARYNTVAICLISHDYRINSQPFIYYIDSLVKQNVMILHDDKEKTNKDVCNNQIHQQTLLKLHEQYTFLQSLSPIVFFSLE